MRIRVPGNISRFLNVSRLFATSSGDRCKILKPSYHTAVQVWAKRVLLPLSSTPAVTAVTFRLPRSSGCLLCRANRLPSVCAAAAATAAAAVTAVAAVAAVATVCGTWWEFVLLDRSIGSIFWRAWWCFYFLTCVMMFLAYSPSACVLRAQPAFCF